MYSANNFDKSKSRTYSGILAEERYGVTFKD